MYVNSTPRNERPKVSLLVTLTSVTSVVHAITLHGAEKGDSAV